MPHGIDHHEAQHRDDDHHDHQRAQHGRGAADGAELIARHLPEALAIAARGNEQHRHVLHAATEHRADDQPQRARQVTELHGESGTDQWAGAGNRGEVMAEQHPALGGNVVAAVAQSLGWRGAGPVGDINTRLDPLGVEAVTQDVHADRRGDDPQ